MNASRMRGVEAAFVLVALVGSGCADSESGSAGNGGSAGGGGSAGSAGSGSIAGSGGGGAPSDDVPDFSLPDSRIRVTTWFQFGETELAAVFADGPQPRQHEEADRDGSCRLMRFRASTCTPNCPGGAVCVSERCEAFPAQLNRGPLEWSWPDGQQTITPTATGTYHGVGAASTTGDVVVVVAGVSLSAPVEESPSPEGDWGQAFVGRSAGESAALRWSNPLPGARVRLHMTDCAGTHGAPAAAEIECEARDSGQLVIPGAFLDEFAQGDWSRGECGSHRLERYFVDGDELMRLETIGPTDFSYRP